MKIKTRFFLFLLLSLLVLNCCLSCAGKEDFILWGTDENGKQISDSGMTAGMFSYFLSQHKGEYFAVLSFNDSSITSDTPEIWQKTAPDGSTYEEKFFEDTLNEAKNLVTANTILYSMPSADDPDKKYSLPEDYLDYIDSLIQQNAINSYGSVMDFESYLLNFGTTLEDYTKLYIMTANIDLLKEALFNDETGSMKISDEDKKQYYADNYYSVKHIFINSSYDEKIDGTRAPVSSAEASNRKKTADEIYNYIKSGNSFESASENFKQSYVTVYEGISSMDINSETANAPELGEALKQMQIGEVKEVESDYGIHVIQRVETDPETYNSNESVLSSINSTLINERYEELIQKYSDLVKTDETAIGEYSIASAVLP